MSNIINWNSHSVKRFFHESVVSYGDGEYCVYIWLKASEEPFYVGMGKGYRFCDVNEHSRSKEFLRIYNSEECVVKIVAYGMSEQEARRFEKDLILAYNDLGFSLVNKQYLVDYYHDHSDSIKRHYWVVDGKIDTVEKWCENYDISYSGVLRRISKGLTLKEALTYPKINSQAKSKKIKSLEFWNSLGLIPGTDFSAKDLGNHTESEIHLISSKLSLGKALFKGAKRESSVVQTISYNLL